MSRLLNVYIVFSKRTNLIMGVYRNYPSAAAVWNQKDYLIMDYPVLDWSDHKNVQEGKKSTTT